MALDSAINTGANTAGKANVDANYNLNVVTPKVQSQAGFVGLTGIVDDGTIVAGGRQNRVYVGEDNGLYAAFKHMLWDDTFNATTMNTSKYKTTFDTMTPNATGGFLNLNSTAITTLSKYCYFSSWKVFPLFGKTELRCNISAQIPNGSQANQTIEWGLFSANPATMVAPTDGVFWRANIAGELRGVISFNGTETQTAAITMPSTSVNHSWVIVAQTDGVIFYVDGVMVGNINLSVDAPTLGQPFMAAAQPITLRVINGASAPALAPLLKVSDITVVEVGADLARPFAAQKAGFGHMAYQGQNGNTMGSTSNMNNSVLASAIALSNAGLTSGNPTGLGGYAHALGTIAVGTDAIISSYQNPAGGAGITPRNLIISGVWIHSIVDLVLAGGPLAYVYALAYGHTAVTLVTPETGSFVTATTKAPRRIALGCEGCAAAAPAGTLLSPGGIYRAFTSPVVVAPGEFVAVVARNMGTVTTSGSIVVTVGYDAYFE